MGASGRAGTTAGGARPAGTAAEAAPRLPGGDGDSQRVQCRGCAVGGAAGGFAAGAPIRTGCVGRKEAPLTVGTTGANQKSGLTIKTLLAASTDWSELGASVRESQTLNPKPSRTK